jgi:hypothetical protein
MLYESIIISLEKLLFHKNSDLLVTRPLHNLKLFSKRLEMIHVYSASPDTGNCLRSRAQYEVFIEGINDDTPFPSVSSLGLDTYTPNIES